jgi:hypothetical protein
MVIRMKLFAILILFLSCLANGAVAKPITLFGRSFDKSVAIYGSFIIPPGPTESAGENAKLEFYLKPSITLHKFSDKTSLVGYSIFAALQDRKRLSFNNKITFLLGLEVQHKLSKSVRLSFGAQVKTEYELTTGINRGRAILTADLNLFKTWKPKWVEARLPNGSKMVLSGWANYRYPGSLHASEKNNGLLQGSFKIAVSRPLGKTKLALAPFVSLKAKADHKGRSFNNIVEPALGIDLKIPFKNGGDISVGAKSVYQWRHASGTDETAILGYVSWYKRF